MVSSSLKQKTKCVHFCQKKKNLHNDRSLKLNGVEIPVVDEYKFLEMIFDKKLTFIPHLKYLKIKCHKTLQLLHVVAHKERGADRNTLLLFYRSLIRSKLDYGSIIYWSARKSYLKTFDPIYCGGLRLVLGAFRTSPVESLYAVANEAPANNRSCKLALQYYVKLNSCPTNPAHHKVFHPKYKELFQKNEKAIKPFCLWMETIIGEAEVDLTKIHKTIVPDIPPWTIRTPNTILTLHKFPQNKTHPLIFQEELEKIKEKYPKHSHIFTEGSKLDKITGCASIHKGKIKNKNISQMIPLYWDNDKQICWLPSQTGINGNDRADKVARSTINLTTEKKFKIPHTDFKMKINKYIQHQRQQCWNNNENNKLLEIKPTLGEWKQSFKKKTKRGNYIVQTQDRSYKDNTLLFTRRKTTTNVLYMPDQIHSYRIIVIRQLWSGIGCEGEFQWPGLLLHRWLRDFVPSHPTLYKPHAEWIAASRNREKSLSRRNAWLIEKYDRIAHTLRPLLKGANSVYPVHKQWLVEYNRPGHWNSPSQPIPDQSWRIREDNLVEPQIPQETRNPGNPTSNSKSF